MLHLLFTLLVNALGGFWKIKRRILECPHSRVRWLYLLLYYGYLKGYCGFIGHSAVIAGPVCFPHGMNGVFIAGGAYIGKNCVIFQHVTIGSNPLPFSTTVGLPVIGDSCYIGAGAAIIGGIRIGNNCRIGANCVVTSDIPDNSLVVMNQPRIIQKTGMVNKYYKWSSRGPVYYEDGKWVLEKDETIIQNLENKI